MPALSPTLSVQFARSKRVPTNMTFSRVDSVACATYVNDKGFVIQAGSNDPRFHHDPITRECLGLLIEEQRTNIVASANNAASWGALGVTYTPGQPSISGANDAVLVTNTGQPDGTSLIFQTLVVTASGSADYFASVFVKPTTTTAVTFNCYYNGGPELDQVTFTFSTMTVSAAPYPNDVLFEKYQDGWYRIGYRISRDSTSSSTSLNWRLWCSGRGNTVGNCLVWGGQCEAGTFPTTLIRTTSAVNFTRGADIASLSGAAFTGWYNQTNGTIIALGNRNLKATSAGMAFSISQNATNRHRGYVTNYTDIVTDTESAGVNQQAITFSGAVKTGKFAIASAIKTNDFAFGVNSNAIQTDTSGTLPAAMATLWIGNDQGTSYFLNGCIESIEYYNTRLPNDQLKMSSHAKEYGSLIEPNLAFNFIRNQVIPPSMFYGRSDAVATYYGSDGLLKTATLNSPRFDYVPGTSTPRGLLMEEASTNMLLYSETFSNAAWGMDGIGTKTDNSVTSPYGTTTAATITTGTATSIFQDFNLQGTALATFSVYLKAGTATTATLAQFRTWNTVQGPSINVNLSNGTITAGTGTIENVGNGWYRVAVPYTGTVAANTTARFQVYFSGTLYMFGAQAEQNFGAATTYIKTTAAPVARAVDSLSWLDDTFAKVFKQSECTLAMSASRRTGSSSNPWPSLVVISDGTTNNRTLFYYDVASSSMRGWMDTATANQFVSGPVAVAVDTPFTQVMSYTSGRLAYTINDKPTEVANGTSVTSGNTSVRIGAYPWGGNPWNGHIRWLMYFPQVMSDEMHKTIINQ